MVVVTGEEDNVFYPGYVPGGFIQNEKGSVDQGQELRYQTPELPAGKYSITLAHDPASPGGDADLIVKVGAVPSATVWDCRPAKAGSAESCLVTLTGTAKIFASVLGKAAQPSPFLLSIKGSGVTPPVWSGLDQSGVVAKSEEKRYQTPTLPAGRYTFRTTGSGDADLYLKVGAAPTTSAWDCRPYQSGSTESCTVNLSTPGVVHLLVRGNAATSSFRLVGAVSN